MVPKDNTGSMLVLCECGWMSMLEVIFVSLIETIFDGVSKRMSSKLFHSELFEIHSTKIFSASKIFDKFLILQRSAIVHSHISSLLERQRTLWQPYWHVL